MHAGHIFTAARQRTFHGLLFWTQVDPFWTTSQDVQDESQDLDPAAVKTTLGHYVDAPWTTSLDAGGPFLDDVSGQQ